MRKSLFCLTIASMMTVPAVMAAPQEIAPPPQISQEAAQAAYQNAQKANAPTNYERVGEAARRHPANPDLAPSAADYEKARQDRAAGRYVKPASKDTEIEAVRDQNNRIREYVVTPGSTHLPYRIENRSERPVDAAPPGTQFAVNIIHFNTSFGNMIAGFPAFLNTLLYLGRFL